MNPEPGRGLEVAQRRIFEDKAHRFQCMAEARKQRAEIPHTFLQGWFPVDVTVVDNEILKPFCVEPLRPLARRGVDGVEEVRKEVDDLAELEPRLLAVPGRRVALAYWLTVSSACVGVMTHGGSPMSGRITVSEEQPRRAVMSPYCIVWL